MKTTKVDIPAVRAFFGELWDDDPPPGEALVIWGGKGGAVHRCASLDAAAAAVGSLAEQGREGYYGVALQDIALAQAEAQRRLDNGQQKTPPERTRGYSSTATAIPGIWLDIDIAGPGHEKPGLPEKPEHVDRILSALPDTTRQVWTGGGVHAYWLFREPWRFESADERGQAETLLQRWHAWAREAGYTLDSVGDLARIMRPVGAWSQKREEVVRWRKGYEQEGPRWNPSELMDLADQFAPTVRVRPEGSTCHVRPEDLRPSIVGSDLLGALHEIPGFSALWAGKAGKKSPSETDFALALMGARGGLSDDEICGLMIEWGRTHRGDASKLERKDYLARTIARAREAAEKAQEDARTLEVVARRQEVAAQTLQEAARLTRDAETTEESDHVLAAQQRARQGALRVIEEALGLTGAGIRLERVLIHPAGEETSYTVEIGDRRCLVPGAAMLTAAGFSAKVSPAINFVIQPLKAEQWIPIARALQGIAEVQELDGAGDLEQMLPQWVEAYTAQAAPLGLEREGDTEAVARAMLDGVPFPREGSYWITLESLVEWLRVRGLGNWPPRHVARALKAMGWSGKLLRVPGNGGRVRAWGPSSTCTRESGDEK